MRVTWPRVSLLLALAAFIAVDLYAMATYLVYDRLSATAAHCGGRFTNDTPARFDTEGVSSEFAADDFDTTPYQMPDFRDVSFPSRDPRQPPLTIRAWWIPAARADAPAVIVVHGWGGCRRDPAILLPAGMLHRNSFSVLMIDMRDHGDSDVEDGRYAAGTEEYRDVLGAWDWLRAQGVPAERIGLFGHSGGAPAVVMAMASEPGVAATWEDSGDADIEEALAEELARAGFPGWLTPGGLLWARLVAGDDLTGRNPLVETERIGARPLEIVHGAADERISAHHARDLAAVRARFVPGYEPWIVPGARHIEAPFSVPDEYERRLVTFFRESLGS